MKTETVGADLTPKVRLQESQTRLNLQPVRKRSSVKDYISWHSWMKSHESFLARRLLGFAFSTQNVLGSAVHLASVRL